MLGKQHISFMHKVLAMLFLFFNCVCTATPVIKAISQDYKQAVSVPLSQLPGAAESEEESQLVVSHVNQLTHFSFAKKHFNHHVDIASERSATLTDIASQRSYITSASLLPKPAYYIFLFRYTLF